MSSKVYFVKASIDDSERVISEKAARLFKAANFANCFKQYDITAVKVHVGESTNNTHVTAPCIKGLIDELLKLKTKPYLTDTSTLYTGRRHNAIDHTILAAEHGFSLEKLGIPFIAPDGLFGTAETAVTINGVLNKEVLIAYDIVRSTSLLSISHFTGHCATCAAATLKTLGMGCASRKGKLRQHSALKPSITDECTICGDCIKHCPVDAIKIDKISHIDPDKCIGCGECVAVCRFGAIKIDWGSEDQLLQQNIAEHALGAIKGKENRAVFFNYIISVTKDCDCFKTPDMDKIVPDIGIVASVDPVAVDKAALDLVEKIADNKLAVLIKNDKLNPQYQFEHAERIGVGTTDYQIVEID